MNQRFMEEFKRTILLEGGYVTQLGPEVIPKAYVCLEYGATNVGMQTTHCLLSAQSVDQQISIEVSNPRLEKVKTKQQQSTRLLAMMKAMMTIDDDDE